MKNPSIPMQSDAGGAQSATLEGSPMGQPVYAHIGYRELGRMRMLELRKPAP